MLDGLSRRVSGLPSFVIHAAPRPAASLAIRAVDVALPPTVRQVD
jgi:hypothetical protein